MILGRNAVLLFNFREVSWESLFELPNILNICKQKLILHKPIAETLPILFLNIYLRNIAIPDTSFRRNFVWLLTTPAVFRPETPPTEQNLTRPNPSSWRHRRRQGCASLAGPPLPRGDRFTLEKQHRRRRLLGDGGQLSAVSSCRSEAAVSSSWSSGATGSRSLWVGCRLRNTARQPRRRRRRMRVGWSRHRALIPSRLDNRIITFL